MQVVRPNVRQMWFLFNGFLKHSDTKKVTECF